MPGSPNDLYNCDCHEEERFPEDIEDAALLLLDSREAPHSDNCERLEQNLEAVFCEHNGRVTVSYDDSEFSEGARVLTQITYLSDDPKCVAIIRSGDASSMYVLEENRRHTCEIRTGGLSLPLVFCARRVINNFTESEGELFLDYVVELSGAVTQRTKMKIEMHSDPSGIYRRL